MGRYGLNGLVAFGIRLLPGRVVFVNMRKVPGEFGVHFAAFAHGIDLLSDISIQYYTIFPPKCKRAKYRRRFPNEAFCCLSNMNHYGPIMEIRGQFG